MQLQILMLGTFEVRRAGNVVHDFRTSTVRLLLAYLALENDRPHEREHLASLLWADVPPEQASTNLRQTLHRLRQALEPDGAEGRVLLITRQSVQLSPAAIAHLDVTAFCAAIAAVRQHHHRAANRCRLCAERLQTALVLFRGELLPGIGSGQSPLFDEWLGHQRERVNAEMSFALQTLAAYAQRRGDDHQAIVYLRRLLALEPWSEDAHVWLMRVLNAAGQRSAALRQFAHCRAALARDLGTEPSEHTAQMAEHIRRNSQIGRVSPQRRLPVARKLNELRTSLFPSSLFIGRMHELERIAEHLSDPRCRLITLVGPGGVGKTRLAVEAATAEASMFEDGAIYVPLAGVVRGEQIYDALAAAMELPLNPNRAVADHVCEHLRDLELLVVLDNCEQIADADVVIGRLLAAIPKMTALVTSRAPLKLRAEWIVSVTGLALGDVDTAPPAESYDAGRLFLHLARRVRGDAGSPDDEPALIAECCRLLAGEPLALELTAFRLYQRNLAEVLVELRRSLLDLAITAPDMPARHQSTRAIFEWSWMLLSEPSQRHLARLSVFRDGFTLAAASALLNDTVLVTHSVSEALDVLVRQSLLQREQHGRYFLHELVRQFAVEHLDADADAAYAQHATFFLELVAAQADGLYGRAAVIAEKAIRAEIDNVRAAWEWALSAGRLDLVAEAMQGLMRFFQRTNVEEGAQVFAIAVEQARYSLVSMDTVAAQQRVSGLLCCHAAFLIALSRPEEAQAAAEAALVLSESDSIAEATSHMYFGEALIDQYELDTAESHLAQAARIADNWGGHSKDKVSARWVHTLAQRSLGYINYMRKEYQIALGYYQWCRDAYHAMESPRNESHMLLYSAEVQRCLGDYGQAKPDYEQALHLIRGTGNLDLENVLLNNLGDVLTHLGCYTQAEALLNEALTLAKHLRNAAAQANIFEGLSRVAHNRGDDHLAEIYARQALSHPENRDRGWYLTALGKALEGQGRLSEAARTYHESVRWWEIWSDTDPILEAHAGLTRIALARGAPHDALPHAEELYRRLHDELMLMEPLSIYLTCWRALKSADDSRADVVLRRAAQLLAKQVARIHDPQLRTSFLDRVAIHREIVAAVGPVDHAILTALAHSPE